MWSPRTAVGRWGSDLSDVTVFGTSALAAKGRLAWPHPSQKRGRCIPGRTWCVSSATLQGRAAGTLSHRHTAPGTGNSCLLFDET